MLYLGTIPGKSNAIEKIFFYRKAEQEAGKDAENLLKDVDEITEAELVSIIFSRPSHAH